MWNSRKPISSPVATRNLHGCGAREPLNLIAGKCGHGTAGTAAASGSRGTSCVASGGRRAADEAGCSAVTRTSLRTSRAESALQQQKRVEKWTNSPLSQNSPLSRSSPLRIRVADVEVLARALESAVIKLSRPLKENERVQEKVRLNSVSKDLFRKR